VLTALLLVACSSSPQVVLPNASIAGTYSNLEFVGSADAVIGYEIRIVPTDKYMSYQATFQRAAADGPGPLALASVELDFSGKRPCEALNFTFGHPYDVSVAACLFVDQLTAELHFPDGHVETIHLPRRTSYWERHGA
jgi:hypothetical protein